MLEALTHGLSTQEFFDLVRAQGQLRNLNPQGIGHGVGQSGAGGNDTNLTRPLDPQWINRGGS